MLLSEGISLYLDYCKNQKKFTDRTIQTYSTALFQFSKMLTSELDTEPEIKEITNDHIKRFASYFYYKKLSKKSIKLKLSAVKSFFKFLYRKEYISEDPSYSVSLPKIEKNIPSFLVSEETEQIFKNLQPSNPLNARNLALIELLYSSGLRISEALGLKVSDVTGIQRTIKVMGKGRKERIVPIGTKAKEALLTYLKFRETIVNKDSKNMLFLSKSGKPLTPTDAYRIVNSLLKKYSKTPQKSPHTLRHTFATHMLNNGADIRSVCEMLGHSSLSSTQIYTHVSIQKIKEEYKKAHPKA